MTILIDIADDKPVTCILPDSEPCPEGVFVRHEGSSIVVTREFIDRYRDIFLEQDLEA